jgi:hypothetical protein
MKITLFLILIMVGLFSCKKDDNSSSSTTITTANLAATASTGNWRVTYYYDTDHEETANYAGYSFTFAGGNVLTATKAGAATVTGTWTTGVDDSKVKLILSFATPASFIEISDDWHVTSRTDTKIVMTDVSGGNGGTDFLTFEKN